jgi:RIO kinase 1
MLATLASPGARARMKTPESLVPALDSGIIQEVVRPLMSGKEAQVYVVVAAGTECVAKVYKEASQRTFKHRAEYTEGRRARNSRDQRAVNKRTRHGRKQDEADWRSTEVDTIYRLRDAGVRVPEPINFVDGVLVMELVKDAEGDPAPRLGDLKFRAGEAVEIYRQLLREVVCMLSAGVIHGDLSDFNVLMAADGPVLIDFPQAIDAASNQNARKLLLRDVENLHRFVGRFSSNPPTRAYAEEMWSLYELGRLEPDSELRGDYRAPEARADIGEVVALIEDADREEGKRRAARGEDPAVIAPRPLRRVVDFTKEAGPPPGAKKRPPRERTRPAASRSRTATRSDSEKAAAATGDATPKKRRSRRRRKTGTSASSDSGARATLREGRTPATTTETKTARPERRKSKTKDPKQVGSDEIARPKRRRRGARAGKRSQSGDAKPSTGTRPKQPARPATSDAESRSGGRPGAKEGGADRPRQRRRRRPRRAPSAVT